MILSPAKVNLSLKVKTRLRNGYHTLSSHIVFINLFDKIFIKRSSKDGLNIIGPFENLLSFKDNDNLISKTLEFCRKIRLTNKKFNVTLEKNIPVSAGLGGGSSNSASIIRYFLNAKKIKDVEKIIQASKSLGADVPSCIYARPIFMEGIGEKISFVDINKNLNIGIVLINPYIGLPTGKVFSQWLPENKIRSEKKFLIVNDLQDFLKINLDQGFLEGLLSKIPFPPLVQPYHKQLLKYLYNV